MEKQVFEQSGLIPRSIIRTVDRFRRQLIPGSENLVIQEFRISRYQVLVSFRSLLALIFIPLLINFVLKTFLLTPLTEFIWNNYQTEIFLNSYQQDHALTELQNFEEKLFFEKLIDDKNVSLSPKDEELIKTFQLQKTPDSLQSSTFSQVSDSSEFKNQTNSTAFDLVIQEELIKKNFNRKLLKSLLITINKVL